MNWDRNKDLLVCQALAYALFTCAWPDVVIYHLVLLKPRHEGSSRIKIVRKVSGNLFDRIIKHEAKEIKWEFLIGNAMKERGLM